VGEGRAYVFLCFRFNFVDYVETTVEWEQLAFSDSDSESDLI